jgi:hypothetical protein
MYSPFRKTFTGLDLEIRAAPAEKVHSDAKSVMLAVASELDPFYKKDTKHFIATRARVTPYSRELETMLRAILPRGSIITNATYKIIEILDLVFPSFAELRVAKQPLKVFFNCEMPGAMLKFTIDCLARNRVPAEFIASSLVQEDSTALPDVYGFFASGAATVLVNEHNNGDVTLADNQRDFRQRYCNWADFYMTDAGVDVGDNFDKVEEINARVCLGQVITGLSCVADKGTLVYKTFTFTTQFSQSIISLLIACFDAVTIFKPATSRPANEEVYVIGHGYHPLSTSKIEMLLNVLESNALLDTTVCELYPPLVAISDELLDRQREALSQFVAALKGGRTDSKKYKETKAKDWIKRFTRIIQ